MTTHAARSSFDPTRVAHLSGRYAPVTEEVDEVGLAVTGELPDDLDGLYLRNGPNPRFSPIGSYLYPIDGDGMLHGVWISQGAARYRNRFVRTPAFLAEERAGRALWGGLESMIVPGEADVGPDLAGTFRDLPDINVVRHGGRLLALAESGCPFRLTPGLETVGPETFGGALPAGITAHPKVDPATGEMAVFCYALEEPFLTWSVIGPEGTVRRGPTPVAGVDEPMMIHDMALTERYLVLVLAPAFFDIAGAMRGGSLIDWRPGQGTRTALIPRDGGPVRWTADEAFWLWHTVNAYDEGPAGDVVLEYVQWDHLGLGPGGGPNPGGLARAVFDPAAGSVRRTLLDDAPVEFPRVDDRLIGRRHGPVAVAAETGTLDLRPSEYDALRWYDTAGGGSRTWRAGDLSVGEPVFAPAAGSGPGDAGRGYWLTFATDRTDATSWLLVFAAEDPSSGPVARVRIPVRVPLGLHGAWLPTEE
ncbi:retinal pigment epithelial membrane protein [Streptomyces subrutilus]|uniref:Dioxygenase n=1 Tax=Streptomyces subrutilus TaxID=36818 RepID=A0A5P2V0B9_9ACTN|nr:carotenoid oxygenase family protein [Streptomyces subrutilus]QEU82487.1 carotenoid oxygenase family protein [Streptomyces subrutilus]GGZ81533.1 retinal pigment epithelial membrane protein [Streptomyces subrutilus]